MILVLPPSTRRYAVINICRSIELEQLERLHSEDIPAASWLPTLLSHIGFQVKQGKSEGYDSCDRPNNLTKNWNQIVDFLPM